jgi:acyl-CoA hydrolase
VGNYNFVAMAHELEDGRSIMMIRSTTEEDGKVRSNIRWNYGHQYLERMELDQPQSFKEKLLQRVVVYALASVNAI